MECYNEFAHIYDALINGDIDYEAWGKFILDVCSSYNLKKEAYLDLACGTGNITEVIAKEFKSSWGIDISSDMLTQAENKMRGKLYKPKFILQDICNLSLNRKFDLITCCLDSVNYVTDSDSLNMLFKGVINHLSPQGLFIFDINSYYKITSILGNNTFTYDSEKVFYVWENCLEEEIVDMYLSFFVKDGELYRRIDEQHKERAYKREEILTLLEENNLTLLKAYDCYSNKEISDKTERITFVTALKKNNN